MRNAVFVLFAIIASSGIWMVLSVLLPTKEGFPTSSALPVLPPSAHSASRQQSSQQPKFFLHVGPHKTATTSIQCALYHYQEILKDKDSLVFLGKVDASFCSSKGKSIVQDERIRKLETCVRDPNDCWWTVTQDWKTNRKAGYGMMLSKELISDLASIHHSKEEDRLQFWAAMEKALLDWNVTVVVTYRRYFEWLPSAFNQHAFHQRIQAREAWPVSPVRPLTMEEVVAGVVEGTAVPPYPFVNDILDWKFPPTWKVWMMNMHDTKDIVKTFFCHSDLNAKHTCATYQPLAPTRQSPAEYLVYDHLNVQALHWGWMKAGRRGQLARSTKAFVESVLQMSPQDFPKDCPSQSLLESFLAYSLAMEAKLLGTTGMDTKQHTELFWKSSADLCTVNATKVLSANETKWKKYFSSL